MKVIYEKALKSLPNLGILSNYCGPGGTGAVQHETDAACKKHDEAYAEISRKGGSEFTKYNNSDENLLQELYGTKPQTFREALIRDTAIRYFEIKKLFAAHEAAETDVPLSGNKRKYETRGSTRGIRALSEFMNGLEKSKNGTLVVVKQVEGVLKKIDAQVNRLVSVLRTAGLSKQADYVKTTLEIGGAGLVLRPLARRVMARVNQAQNLVVNYLRDNYTGFERGENVLNGARQFVQLTRERVRNLTGEMVQEYTEYIISEAQNMAVNLGEQLSQGLSQLGTRVREQVTSLVENVQATFNNGVQSMSTLNERAYYDTLDWGESGYVEDSVEDLADLFSEENIFGPYLENHYTLPSEIPFEELIADIKQTSIDIDLDLDRFLNHVENNYSTTNLYDWEPINMGGSTSDVIADHYAEIGYTEIENEVIEQPLRPTPPLSTEVTTEVGVGDMVDVDLGEAGAGAGAGAVEDVAAGEMGAVTGSALAEMGLETFGAAAGAVSGALFVVGAVFLLYDSISSAIKGEWPSWIKGLFPKRSTDVKPGETPAQVYARRHRERLAYLEAQRQWKADAPKRAAAMKRYTDFLNATGLINNESTGKAIISLLKSKDKNFANMLREYHNNPEWYLHNMRNNGWLTPGHFTESTHVHDLVHSFRDSRGFRYEQQTGAPSQSTSVVDRTAPPVMDQYGNVREIISVDTGEVLRPTTDRETPEDTATTDGSSAPPSVPPSALPYEPPFKDPHSTPNLQVAKTVSLLYKDEDANRQYDPQYATFMLKMCSSSFTPFHQWYKRVQAHFDSSVHKIGASEVTISKGLNQFIVSINVSGNVISEFFKENYFQPHGHQLIMKTAGQIHRELGQLINAEVTKSKHVVHITGFGLGGAVAECFSQLLSQSTHTHFCYTFNSPAWCEASSAQALDLALNHWSVCNLEDPMWKVFSVFYSKSNRTILYQESGVYKTLPESITVLNTAAKLQAHYPASLWSTMSKKPYTELEQGAAESIIEYDWAQILDLPFIKADFSEYMSSDSVKTHELFSYKQHIEAIFTPLIN